MTDPFRAQWLQADALWMTQASAEVIERWQALAIVAERLTGIATPADALAEAVRQLVFLGRGPFAIDVHVLVGTAWTNQLACIVTLTIDQLGYDDGIDVFVLEVEADHSTGLSNVAVLRSLKDGA